MPTRLRTHTPRFAGRLLFAVSALALLSASVAVAQDAGPPEPAAVASPAVPAQRINPTARNLTLEVEIFDVSGAIGNLQIVVSPTDEISMNVDRLIDIIKPIVKSRQIDALRAAAAGDGTITLDQVNAAGVAMQFDMQRYGLRLEVSLDERGAIDINLAARNRQLNFQPPENFSFYLNYNISLDYLHKSSFEPTGVKSPTIDLDTYVNLYGFVLENELTYDQDNAQDFSRQATRLVYDLPDEAIRISLGDNRTVSRGYIGSEDILGITVSRLYTTLQPGRNIRPQGSSAFTLDRESQVDILVNGLTTRSVRLPAGSYNLSDLGFTQGSNDVQIVAQDSSGRRELASFSYFFDYQLLDPGLVEFSLSYGVFSDLLDGERLYDEDRYFASGFFRIGVLDNLTAGASFAHDDTGLIIGGEALLSTPIGLFGFDGAYSDIDALGTGQVGRVSYQGTFKLNRPADLLILLSTEYRSELFSNLGIFAGSQRTEFTHSGSINYNVNDNLTLFAGGQYVTYRDGSDDTWGANAGFAWRFAENIQFRAAATAERDDTGDMEYGFGIRITARFGTDQFASASYDSTRERYDLNWSRSPGLLTDDWEANVGVTGNNDDAALNAGIGYVSNRGAVRLEHGSSYNIDGSQITDARTSLRAEGSVAFTGGKVAVGRRIFDSFAIVDTHPSLGDARVLIDPTKEGDYTAKSDGAGPALVADIGGYSPRTISYAVPDAPPGYNLGVGNFSIQPTYRSGFALTVGSAYNAIVVGTVVDATGTPMGLEPGIAESVDDPDAPKVELFTNKEGRFVATGLGGGTWRITIGTGAAARSFTVTVPEDQTGLIQVGTKEAR